MKIRCRGACLFEEPRRDPMITAKGRETRGPAAPAGTGVKQRVGRAAVAPVKDESDDQSNLGERALLKMVVTMMVEALGNARKPRLHGGVRLPVTGLHVDSSAFAGDELAAAVPSNELHVVLIHAESLKPISEELAACWDDVVHRLPQSPVPSFGTQVHRAERDDDSVTWFVPVENQGELQSYVEMLRNELRVAIEPVLYDRGKSFPGFDDLGADTFYYVIVANNRGGDPRRSVTDITEDDLER